MHFLCPVMPSAYFWPLFTLLCLTVQGKQHGLSVPEIVRVYVNKSNRSDFGVWEMNVEWRDNSISGNNPEQVTYDVEIFYTEQMRLVHNETIEDPMGTQHWSWTSPIPLQCTSHSVRLRSRHLSDTSDWTPLYTLEGEDTEDTAEVKRSVLYPKDYVARIGEGIIFCCILQPDSVVSFSSPEFLERISNRTYVSRPVRHNDFSPAGGFDIHCDDSGTSYFVGGEPDDRDLACETRDLESVECHWSRGETGEAKQFEVHYQVNGRTCPFDKCVLDGSIDEGVMNWTLSAENELGVKIISDVADPKHRVRLIAPRLRHAAPVHARNATLEWETMTNSRSFQIICQVEVNGHTVEERFSGPELTSLVLTNLQPFTEYSARVQCGSQEHFYKWGDWSDPITFLTKEDIPEAVDVWMKVFDGQTYVVWKDLTASQSHGTIKEYELLLGNSTDVNKKSITKPTSELCLKLSPGISAMSVSAKNSAGASPPSKITIPTLRPGGGNITGPIIGHNGAFSMSWDPSPNSSCGYVLDWFPTYSREQCAVQWMKTPPGVSNVTVHSEFKNGEKYTLSVYVCTSGAPQLLQRREGYVKELAPSGRVRNLKAQQHAMDVELSWEDVLEEKKNGFILGYIVSYKLHTNGSFIHERTADPSSRTHRLSGFHPGNYTFTVKAFTSAGEGPGSDITYPVDHWSYTMVISILAALGTVSCAITSIVLCCSKRKWLKAKLYPDTPKPVLSEEWHTQCHVLDKLLLTEKEVAMVKNPESCLLVVPLVQEVHEEVDSKTKVPLWTEYRRDICNQKRQTLPPLTVDFSYLAVQAPGIQNPTYNIPLSLPDDTNLVLGYMPQIQNVSPQLQPYEVRAVQIDSVGYQPQSQVLSQSPAIPQENILPRHSTTASSSGYLLHSACR